MDASSDAKSPNLPAAGSTTVLLVDTDPEQRQMLAVALTTVAAAVHTAATFADARTLLLAVHPDVLVTQVRLEDFNGMHLALWGRMQLPHLRSVIVGESDPALEADARRSGFFFVRSNDQRAVLQATQEAVARDTPRRRWQRKLLAATLDASIDGKPARIVEVSYGGFRAQMPVDLQPGTDMGIEIPSLAIRAEATCRWVTPAPKSDAYWCGVSLSTADVRPGSTWRALVDRLPVAHAP